MSSHEDRGRCPESFQTYFKPELDKSDELRNFSMLIYVLMLKGSTLTVETVELFSSFHKFIDFLVEALPEGPVQARGGPTGVGQF